MGLLRLFTPDLTIVEHRGFYETRKNCEGKWWPEVESHGAAEVTDTGIFSPLLYQRH